MVLPAGRPARDPQDRGDHPRGDGRDRRPRAAAAGTAAGRALAQDRPLRDRRALQALRPQGLGHGPGDDPRGGADHARRQRGALLPRAAADALPDPDQGTGRAAAPGRRAAHARVHDEGRLLLRPRPGGPAGQLRQADHRLRPDLRPLRAALVPGRLRRRDDGRLRRRRVHGSLHGRRGRGRARPATTRPTSTSPAPIRSRSSCRRHSTHRARPRPRARRPSRMSQRRSACPPAPCSRRCRWSLPNGA